MVPIVKQMCPESRYAIKCPYTRIPDRFVVHNTGNDAPAINEVTYMINRSEEISFHMAIDDVEIRQALPFDRNAWASGDGRGDGNMKGIHIEICYSLSGGPKFIQAEKNAAEYIASQLLERGWGLSRVTKHQDYDGKYCPHRTLDMGWQRFLNMVSDYMKKESDIVDYETFKKYQEKYEKERMELVVSSWAKNNWDKACAMKIFDGTMPRAPLTREQAAAILDRLGLLDK